MNRPSERRQPCPRESQPWNSRTRLSALLSIGSWPRCAILESSKLPINRPTPERVAYQLLCAFMLLLLFCSTVPLQGQTPSPHDYAAVDAIFNQHCLDCHASQDAGGQFVLESYEALMKGGEIGPAILPGRSGESLLVKMIEGRFEKEGKKKIMPPGKRKKLTPEEIATIKGWIDGGAPAPAAATGPKELVVPRIEPKVAPRNPVNALASSPADEILAIARYAEVELRATKQVNQSRTLAGHTGNVNALAFSADGAQVFSAAGQPGLFGEVRQWNVADGKLIRVIQGHKDAIYALTVSPDGAILATGSYDQKIKLWDAATGKETRTLSGHNGCVRDLAFRPDGKILASASADRTVKLWDVMTGERRETLSQPIKEVHSVAFSVDGKRLFAGGADNRIRVWEISENAAETTNPLVVSKFAHEGAILKLVFSSDGKLLLSSAEDRTVRLWDAAEMKERVLLEKQPDWAPALAFVAGDTVAAVGRLDGSVGFYNVATGTTVSLGNETPIQQKVVRAGQPNLDLK